MGYSITIGELEKSTDPEERDSAVEVHFDHAPADGSPTDYTNARWPSYGGWADFLDATNLGFLSPRTNGAPRDPTCPPLLEDHPGVMPVLPVHRARIEAAYAAYVAKLPPHANVRSDHNLARLTWLLFWVRWALDNCYSPVCANS